MNKKCQIRCIFGLQCMLTTMLCKSEDMDAEKII